MLHRIADLTAEEWARRKAYSEDFFHACFVDEEAAILVRQAELAGDINMTSASQLWNEIASGIRYHRYYRNPATTRSASHPN